VTRGNLSLLYCKYKFWNDEQSGIEQLLHITVKLPLLEHGRPQNGKMTAHDPLDFKPRGGDGI
jgi:hypothetical protein